MPRLRPPARAVGPPPPVHRGLLRDGRRRGVDAPFGTRTRQAVVVADLERSAGVRRATAAARRRDLALLTERLADLVADAAERGPDPMSTARADAMRAGCARLRAEIDDLNRGVAELELRAAEHRRRLRLWPP